MKLYLNESNKNRLNEKVDINKTFKFLDEHFYTNGTIDKKYLCDSIAMVIDNTEELYDDIANTHIKIPALVWKGFIELVNLEIKYYGLICDSNHLKKWLSERTGINDIKNSKIYDVLKPLYAHYEKERKERIAEIKNKKENIDNISLDELINCQSYANSVVKYYKSTNDGELPRYHSDAESAIYMYNDNVRSFESKFGYPIEDYIDEIANEIGLIVESELDYME